MTNHCLSGRSEFRRRTRALLKHQGDAALHLARLHAALQLDGVEPVQGALADLFGSFDESAAALKAQALQLATPRLGARNARRFQAWVAAKALPRITPLATRWSLFTRASADVSTRARRCGADDSRAMAAQALRAWEQQELVAQEQFLHYCLSCQDRLAFMLVRREILKRQRTLPAGWAAVEMALQTESASV
ncbi:hypothetical protein SAMN05216344_103233 [Polaromonas sp. OV174]|uniref:hypothetical protein n=1 Tax=Polaromonas sp. OV174 TaxID=1855300 RepID=UPI0008EEDCD8|nr:hypothetical protein [Polaromonas sp. OV174]SFB80785.1 hypothetical protein SAMN05216344_103233 [Polaromonas sp. OV174]